MTLGPFVAECLRELESVEAQVLEEVALNEPDFDFDDFEPSENAAD